MNIIKKVLITFMEKEDFKMNSGHKIKNFLGAVCVLVIACLMVVPGSVSELSVTHKTTITPLDVPSTIYVDGKNTAGPWDGTLEHPYQFIQDGIYNAEEGDTVFVLNATYHENPVIYMSLNLIGENMETTIIDGSHTGSVVQILTDCVTLSGFTITNGGADSDNAGVMIQASYCLVTENTIKRNDYYGVYAAYYENTLYHNNFIQNSYQAFDASGENTWDDGYPCGGNYWSDYTGVDANEDGIGDIPYPIANSSFDYYPLIHPYGSVINENTSDIFLTIRSAIADENTLNGHHIFVKNGRYDEHVCIDKTLVLQGEDSKETSIDGGGIGTVVTIMNNSVTLTGFTITQSGNGTQEAGVSIQAENDLLTGNVIKENYQGVLLSSSAMDAEISHNSITLNRWNGVMLEPGCTEAFVFENAITDNFFAGIGVSQASGNFIFHNNLMLNRHNAYDDGANVWDDGYPSGGNYWDDYTGADQMHGLAQNQPGSDGIGDTPYMVPSGINKDRYPLMDPYTGSDTIPPTIQVLSPLNGLYIRNHRFLAGLMKNRIIIVGRITITAEASDAQSGIAKVAFYVDDMVTPQAVVTQPPYQWTWTNRSLLTHHKHTIDVVAFDNAGNINEVLFSVHRYF